MESMSPRFDKLELYEKVDCFYLIGTLPSFHYHHYFYLCYHCHCCYC